ncbi:glycosyltransferase family 1 protein [Prodigiosinella confusarubida]|uniref:Glycosyltransferase family 1 protein n=2 Tax=Serratia sp. (strain ATCC 39006) TaxID=104623 RepID=A0A2I5TIK2_SERS3|nr:glycosyltransferase family 1 protein [Serratia sp. ATCC 39006]AUH04395.1 glycosyltransferase family 1 protein [Serratia sp. ATCC 39006]
MVVNNIAPEELMKLFFFQPYMTTYREPFFEDIHCKTNGEFEVICSVTPQDFHRSDKVHFKMTSLAIKKINRLFFFRNIPWKKIRQTPSCVIHFADFKYISLYQSVLLKCISFTRVYLHGQGGYKSHGTIAKLFYFFSVLLTDGYICYNEFCAIELKKKLPYFLHRKVFHIDNCLYLNPVEKINADAGKSIAFIGRIRPRCGLEELLDALELARQKDTSLTIEIVGSGDPDFIVGLSRRYSFAHFHGAVYDEEHIKHLLSSCLAGAYGGDAGLSVVHYMALGLPVIVHNDLRQHMGPEPAYVRDAKNGLLFEKGNIDSLSKKLLQLADDRELRNRLAGAALDTFHTLQSPSMADKLLNIIKE